MLATKVDVLLLCNLATGFMERKDFREAHSLLEEAARSAGGDERLQGLVRMALCRLHFSLGDLDRARTNGAEALELLRRRGGPDEVAQAAVYLANVEGARGRFQAAEGLYGRALRLARRSQNRRLVMLASWGLGNVAHCTGRVEDAFRYYQSALESVGELADPREQAAIQMGLAITCRQRGELERALELSTKARSVFESSGQAEVVADLYNNIGSIFVRRGERHEARASYEQALAVLEDQASVQAAEAYREMARLDIEDGRFGEALDRAEAGLEIALRTGCEAEVANCSLVVGQALMGLGRPEAAVPHVRRAEAIFSRLGIRQARIVASQLIRDAERGVG